MFVDTVCHFQRLPNNIKHTMTKVKVQQELRRMIISGYEHKKKETLCTYLKRKCISDFAFLPVNCFQRLSCAKKRRKSKKSVEIVHEL